MRLYEVSAKSGDADEVRRAVYTADNWSTLVMIKVRMRRRH